jgi:pyocin large subunit-like protein
MSGPTSSNDGAASGRFGALRWALLQRSGDTTANLLLIHMAAAGNRSWLSFKSVAKLGQAIECDRRTVQRKLQHLLRQRYIADRYDPRRKSRTYRLRPDDDGEDCG